MNGLPPVNSHRSMPAPQSESILHSLDLVPLAKQESKKTASATDALDLAGTPQGRKELWQKWSNELPIHKSVSDLPH